MAYTTINKSADYFNTVLYTGNGSTQSITGVGFQPDFTWIKNRGSTDWNWLQDAVRGATKVIFSNTSNAESTQAQGLTSFNSDGFTVGTDTGNNGNGNNIVSWNWKAGTTSGISGGTITPTGYSINATSGFGIYKYTGNGTSGATIAHGLGKVPKMIIVKRLDSSPEWQIYHTAMGNTKWIELTNGTPQTGSSRWNDTSPTNTLFYLGNDSDVNYNGGNYIAYVFADITGYSKFGQYKGNGDADGTFIYTGFKPAFVLQKRFSSNEHWHIFDNVRDPSNVAAGADDALRPNLNNAEISNWGVGFDFLSNGFKARATDGAINQSGGDYLYMAFGQTLVGSNNIPATAR